MRQGRTKRCITEQANIVGNLQRNHGECTSKLSPQRTGDICLLPSVSCWLRVAPGGMHHSVLLEGTCEGFSCGFEAENRRVKGAFDV